MNKDKEMLKLNLQLFAEDTEGNPEAGNDDDKQEESKDKTLTQEEVNRLIAIAKSKAKEEAKKEQNAEFDTLKAELEELRKNSMTTSQLKEYEEEERKRKDAAKDKELAELKAQLNQRDMKDKAIATLSEKGLPVNEKTLSIVVKDTAEETLSMIDVVAELLTDQKRESAKTPPPIGSGGMGQSESVSNDNLFKKARITQF